jgi:hypothetical protein
LQIDFEMKVRIVHLWTIPDKANPAEDGSIQMFLVDDKVNILLYYLKYMLFNFFLLFVLFILLNILILVTLSILLGWKNSGEYPKIHD